MGSMRSAGGGKADLPLRRATPPEWAELVLREPLALLNDHAYLEKKAALNVLDLLNRWPDGADAPEWIATLAGIARDEATHLTAVAGLLRRRGGALDRTHKNPYASDLHKLVRTGRGHEELADRLLISALIEARSCERFGVLARRGGDDDLAGLYRSLWASEFGHYKVFLRMALDVPKAGNVSERWDWMLNREAEIIARQAPGPRIHSGI